MRLLFMGSGRFAVPSLRAVLESPHEVLALVTQPDKPAGRGHDLRTPPTKDVAMEHSLLVYQPAKVRSPESVDFIREVAPQCIVVVAYGQIIPKAVLDIPPRGIINVHASVLPRYRGAAPIQWAIARGEKETGVTTMLMDEGLDTGPILLTRKAVIQPDDTGETLEHRLSQVGSELLLETLDLWEQGRVEPKPQDDARASRAPRIKKEDAQIDWRSTASEIACRVRAFAPWPVAFTEVGTTTVRVFKADVAEPGPGVSGETLAVGGQGILVACGSGTRIRLIEIQAEGKNRMPAADFARGHRLTAGTLWGSPTRGPKAQQS